MVKFIWFLYLECVNLNHFSIRVHLYHDMILNYLSITFKSKLTLIICKLESEKDLEDKRKLKRLQMKPTLAICRQEKVKRKKSLYGIAFIVLFATLTNLQIFMFYGFHQGIITKEYQKRSKIWVSA